MLGEHIGRYPSPDGWVFTAAEGGPVHHHNFRRRHFVRPYVDWLATAVVPDGLRFHDPRHTCAAFLIDAGRSLERGEGVPRPLEHPRHVATATGTCSRRRAPRSRTRSTRSYREAPAASPRPARRNRASVANANQRRRRAADLRTSLGADDGIRTRDPHLGKVMLYQLSHVRVSPRLYQSGLLANRCGRESA